MSSTPLLFSMNESCYFNTRLVSLDVLLHRRLVALGSSERFFCWSKSILKTVAQSCSSYLCLHYVHYLVSFPINSPPPVWHQRISTVYWSINGPISLFDPLPHVLGFRCCIVFISVYSLFAYNIYFVFSSAPIWWSDSTRHVSSFSWSLCSFQSFTPVLG